ncbi:hypothetical protein MOK15_00630 [Sphingobium sp. BYY-5]|uniref:hypothetical protein n=1 Tax=Sphingobium sp. BYY-5 TaxID=2926400 RepID=UPI001FA7DEBA|nr:hypothetical protein [Sphingobium sp. BYY-5]MCI4588614.1 hypothetical protein [Sphingobium sp. BYY-5]
MSIEMLSTQDALERIKASTQGGQQVLGVDGFKIVPEGYIGLLDLILDLSVHPISPQAAESAALQFVEANARDGVMWEIVIGRPTIR